jgi:GntR family transcriptional regulator, rspAB operon transcriptional repressor
MHDPIAAASTRARERGRIGAAYVFDALRQDIIALTLAPGSVLSRAELQDRFALSSTPVRDALMRLQEEGLVEVFPQHATVVSPIDLEKARQGQFLRRSIESEIVRVLASKPDRRVTERLNSLIRQQSAFAKLGEYDAFTAADQAFHKMMYLSTNVADLWEVVARHSGHIDRLRRLHLPVGGKMRDVIRDHKAIVAAITAGKPVEAQERLRDHLSRSLGFVETLRRKHPGYFRK